MTRGGAGFLVTPRPKNGPVITGRRLSRNVPVQVGRESTGDGRESDDDAFVALLYVMTVASLLLS